MFLQILIPQYNETERVISALLDSIQIQQGVNLANDIGVIIVNDGSTTFLSDEFLTKYSFPIEYHKDKHRGIPGTRNALLRYAQADYVMFCDADDMFGSMVAVYSVLRSIFSGGFDELISYFYNETYVQNNALIYSENTRVIHPFIHGKVFNRKYLADNNIWFNEEISYHEDVYFSFLAHSCATEIKLLQQFAYIWKSNPQSITHTANFSIKNYTDSLKAISLVCDELVKREKTEDASFYYTCCLFNSYFFMHQPNWLSQTKTIYWKRICKGLQDLWHKHGQELFENADQEKIDKIWEDTKASNIQSTGLKEEELEPFKEWLMPIVEANYDEE